MASHKEVLVVGGGPAGIQAALAAAVSGCSVTLVSDGALGGRAAWQTLLPSKLWLGAETFLEAPVAGTDFTAMLHARYEQIVGNWQRHLLDELERAGVELIVGVASFLSPREMQVLPPEGGYSDQLSADAIILAPGAVPFLPPGLQPDGERIYSPGTVWRMSRVPESMVVIGAGGPATEYVDAFSRLGVRITWVTGPVGVLSAFPPDAGRVITQVMEHRGVKIVTGITARQFERTAGGVRLITAGNSIYEAEAGFVAIGLRPDFERLNLAAAGLRAGSSGGISTDPFGRTSVQHIYLVGDAASPLSANISMAQGRQAGWHAAGRTVEPLRLENAVMAIYTNPQVAVVGRMSAREEHLQKIRLPFTSCLRAHLQPEPALSGLEFVEVSYDSQRRVAGGLAICPEAAEILTSLAVAIHAGMTIDELASVFPAHPTYSELSVLAARMAK